MGKLCHTKVTNQQALNAGKKDQNIQGFFYLSKTRIGCKTHLRTGA